MAVRFHKAGASAGPVAINAATTVARNDLVRVVNGLVVPVVDDTVVDMAVVLDSLPDADYEEGATLKPTVQLARLGEDCEVEMPFTGAIAQVDVGLTFNILALNGGTVNLDDVTDPAFTVRRFGEGVAVGDTTGTVVGVFLDSVSF